MALDFSFSDEHEELRATVRAFLEEHQDETAVREHMASEQGFDSAVWSQMAEQMGLAGLIIPDDHGGAGMSYVELLVVMEEMGRALACSPFLGTAVFSANALLHCATEQAQKELLPKIASGELLASVAYAEPKSGWDITGVELEAKGSGGDVTLSGTKCFVLDGHSAGVLLVVARGSDGVGLYQVAPDAKGVTRSALPELDLTRKLAQIELRETPATQISSGDQSAALERVLGLTLAALAAEQVGGAQACLDMSTDYAKTRLQFGRPIGSYQGIKHKCAEMLVSVEFAKSAAYNACFAAAEDAEDFLESAAMAKAYCSESYFHAAADTIQIHGGMGFTWEHPAHLYFKRAKASELLFGDGAHHREALADKLGI